MSSRPVRPTLVFLTPLVGRGRGIALRRRLLFSDPVYFDEAEARGATEAEKADLTPPDDFSDDEFLTQTPITQIPSPKTAAKVETLVQDVAEATTAIRLLKSDVDNFVADVNKWSAEVEEREARLDRVEKEIRDLAESISRLTFLSELTSDAVIKIYQTR